RGRGGHQVAVTGAGDPVLAHDDLERAACHDGHVHGNAAVASDDPPPRHRERRDRGRPAPSSSGRSHGGHSLVFRTAIRSSRSMRTRTARLLTNEATIVMSAETA